MTGSGSANINPNAVTDVSDEGSYITKLSTDSMTTGISFAGVPVYSEGVAYTPAIWDILLFVYENDTITRAVKITQQTDSQPEDNKPDSGGATEAGGAMGAWGTGAMGGGIVSSEEEEYELFSLEGTSIMTVTPMDKVSVSFTVDELDILSLSKGQEAMITIDALPGQSFEGVVTSINISGENRKYSVEVSFDRTEKMLAGYNCSITISTETKENISTVPVKALVESGGHTYLYTSYDKREEELTDPVEIETGISDGNNVEVDLPEGTEYWYEYYDTAPFQFPF